MHIHTYTNTYMGTTMAPGAVMNIQTYCNSLQHTATHYNALQHTAAHCGRYNDGTRCSYEYCNLLQHNATHCNTMQHTAAGTTMEPGAVMDISTYTYTLIYT